MAADNQAHMRADAPALGVAGKAAILFSTLLTAYAMVGLSVVLPAIEAHFSDTPGAGPLVRFLVTCIGLTMVFGAPVSGLLAERFGKRRVLVIAICIYGVAGTMGLFLDNLWLLVASRVVLGFATAAIGTILITMVTTVFEGGQRDKWLGWLATFGTLGAVLLIPASGFLGQIGWRAPFVLYLIALPLLGLVLTGIPHERAAAAETARAGVEAEKSGFPWALALTALVTGIVATGASLFIPFHLNDMGISDPAAISMVLMPATVSGAVASAFFGRFRQRVSMLLTFSIGFLLAGGGVAMLGAATGMAAAIAAQVMAGIGIGLAVPNMYALAAVTGLAGHRARNVGIVKGIFAAGPFFGQILLEPVAQAATAGWAIIVVGLAGCVAAGVYAVARYRQPALA